MPPYKRDRVMTEKIGWQNLILGVCLLFLIFSLGLSVLVVGIVLDIQDVAIVGGLFLGFGVLVLLVTILFQYMTGLSTAKVGAINTKDDPILGDLDYRHDSSTLNLNPKINASPNPSQVSLGRHAESVNITVNQNRTRTHSAASSNVSTTKQLRFY